MKTLKKIIILSSLLFITSCENLGAQGSKRDTSSNFGEEITKEQAKDVANAILLAQEADGFELGNKFKYTIDGDLLNLKVKGKAVLDIESENPYGFVEFEYPMEDAPLLDDLKNIDYNTISLLAGSMPTYKKDNEYLWLKDGEANHAFYYEDYDDEGKFRRTKGREKYEVGLESQDVQFYVNLAKQKVLESKGYMDFTGCDFLDVDAIEQSFEDITGIDITSRSLKYYSSKEGSLAIVGEINYAINFEGYPLEGSFETVFRWQDNFVRQISIENSVSLNDTSLPIQVSLSAGSLNIELLRNVSDPLPEGLDQYPLR